MVLSGSTQLALLRVARLEGVPDVQRAEVVAPRAPRWACQCVPMHPDFLLSEAGKRRGLLHTFTVRK